MLYAWSKRTNPAFTCGIQVEKKFPLISLRAEPYLGLMPARLQERISMFSIWNNLRIHKWFLKIQCFSVSSALTIDNFSSSSLLRLEGYVVSWVHFRDVWWPMQSSCVSDNHCHTRLFKQQSHLLGLHPASRFSVATEVITKPNTFSPHN